MRKLIVTMLLSASYLGFGQYTPPETVNDSVDNSYREDQFYVGITYNLLGNKPENLAQNGFSTGVQVGFIRDFPVNDRRNVAIGVGLGYVYNSINQNLLVQQNDQDVTTYQIVSNDDFTRNRLALHLFELPIEFRWRTSTSKGFSFWRIYTGFKFGYLFSSRYSYKGVPGDTNINNLEGINNLQYGLTLSAGYDKINLHFYYGLSNIFDNDVKLSNSSIIDSNIIKIGLIIYIL